MHDEYLIGETIILTGTFVRVSDGTLQDPITITLTITHPDGTSVVKAIGDLTHIGTGQYAYDLNALANGVLTHRWVAAGNGVSADTTEYVLVGQPDHTGPCDLWLDWPEVFSCAPASSVAEASRDYNLAVEAATAASRILFLLSDRRYPGICTETVRPCRRASWYGGAWHSSWGVCGCSSFSACGCGGISEVRLPADYPILGVARVRVDGDTISPSAYRIDDWGWLVRTDGNAWPSSQDLSADPTSDPNTFDVTYYYGRRPDADGQMAAKRYASELYAACGGTGGCSLPRRIQEVSRRGEDILFADPQFYLENGLTGIDSVDQFLMSDRYGAGHLGTVIASPDFTSTSRRTV